MEQSFQNFSDPPTQLEFFAPNIKENPINNAEFRISFLLGAGASKPAGIPTTYEFVEEFNENIVSDGDLSRINKVIQDKIKDKLKDRPIDIEILLRTINEIINFDKFEKTAINAFINEDEIYKTLEGDNSDVKSQIKILYEKLLNFIRVKVIIPKEEVSQKIEYLTWLKAFFIDKPLEIYSVNYDTVIEQFCAGHRLDFTDGFSEAWNPRLFNDDKELAIKLFKIHGSITWYKTEYNRFIKSIVRIRNSSENVEEDGIELITGEKAKNLMLYPAQKYEYYEPLFELLMIMKENLALCNILIVVGYSFRDDHVRQILWDIARKNKSFRIVLVGPDSWFIYKDRLRYYDNKSLIPSSLEKKVVCLPYAFEKFFPHLTDLLKDFNDSNKRYEDCSNKKIKGENANALLTCWISCLLPTIKSGNHLRFNDILENEIKWEDSIFKNYSYNPGMEGNFFTTFIKVLIFNCIKHIAIFNNNIEDINLLQKAIENLRKYLIRFFEKIDYSIINQSDFLLMQNFKYTISIFDSEINPEFEKIKHFMIKNKNGDIFIVFGKLIEEIKSFLEFFIKERERVKNAEEFKNIIKGKIDEINKKFKEFEEYL